MRATARHIRETLSSSYWFVPSLMIAIAVGMAFAMIKIDYDWQPEFDGLYSGGPEGARALLSTIASSVITVAGVAFSITIATLTQASSQFGPRLLRNFMRDRGNQIVLGTFTATFVYCILIVRTIRGEDTGDFVPNLSVTVGVLLALSSIGVLVYFIHHISRSLQAPIVTATAAMELQSAIKTHFTARDQPQRCERDGLPAEHLPAHEVHVHTSGYVQAIDEEGLVDLAREHDCFIRMHIRAGDFAISTARIASVWPREKCGDEVATRVRQAVIIGRETTAEQDVEFAIHQLVGIAARALSPSINDPFTAMGCIDWLSDAICLAAQRHEPAACLCDEAGAPRVHRRAWTFEGIVEAAFIPIRQNLRSSIPCMIRLLDQLAAIATCVRHDEQRNALRAQVLAIGEDMNRLKVPDSDRHDLNQRYHKAVQAIEGNETTERAVERNSECTNTKEDDNAQ